ncbi:MAG: phosphodiester glycosidase family protein, partial [Treponema sp.]|nr:phosphodiester glycosidase family protein [Treponema sp.]
IKFTKQEKGYKGEVVIHQDNIAEKGSYIIGGFFTILKDGELFDSTGKNFSYTSHDSRTAAAFSKDGTTLYILVVEGEKKNISKGLSYPECAKLFKAAGGYSAIEFDGGSSSAIFLHNKNMLSYNTLRNTASCIGFYNIKYFHFA